MAVFFIAAGYFYKSKVSENVQSVSRYVVRKIKGLWVPYALWTAIFSLLRNFFIDINVYTNNPQILETVNSKFAFVTPHPSPNGDTFPVQGKVNVCVRFNDEMLIRYNR